MIASTMPSIAPSSSTPAVQPIDSQNSQAWMRRMRCRSRHSISPITDAMTTAASALYGSRCSSCGASSSSAATPSAPTTPVICDCEPAASATGVRDELLLMGKPWNRPTARLVAPSATISWFGSTGWRRRCA